MTTDYPTPLHRWFDQVWNEPDREINAKTIREMLTDDTVHHGLTGPGGPPVRGYDEFEAFHAMFKDAFPNIQVEIHDVITENDKIAARYTASATQNGQMANMIGVAMRGGPPSVIEPTGKRTIFEGGGICTIKGEKFVEVWNFVDFLKLHYDLSPDTPDLE